MGRGSRCARPVTCTRPMIARCLPVVVHAAAETQLVMFTASAELAEAAVAAGATRIELERPVGALT